MQFIIIRLSDVVCVCVIGGFACCGCSGGGVAHMSRCVGVIGTKFRSLLVDKRKVGWGNDGFVWC